jgi:outer membrane protein OmpA-like peptidoglycan-associated protein
MRRYLLYIGGAALAAGLGLVTVLTREAAPPPPVTAQGAAPGLEQAPHREPGDAASTSAPAPEVTGGGPAAPDTATAALDARIDELTTTLAAREADLATLQATFAAREAELGALQTTLAARDATLEEMTATVSARQAELQTLRDELAALRERYAFDLQLAALKGDPPPELRGEASALPAAAEAAAPERETPSVLALTAIHFDSGSSNLSPGGQVHAAAAAVMLAEMTVTRIRLLGFTDRAGSVAKNRTLAAERARAVADFLVAQGVPADLIEAAPMGEDGLPVSTDDGVPEPLNRSVAIVALPLPTS